MNARMSTGWSIALVMFLAACGSDDKDGDVYEVSSSPLTGTVAGEPFEVRGGYAEDKFDDGEYWIQLYSGELEDPCGFNPSVDGPSIIISAGPEPSNELLSFQNNITFSYGDSQNDVATEGRLIIDGVEGDMLSGALYAIMQEHNVDGTFSVPVCPSE